MRAVAIDPSFRNTAIVQATIINGEIVSVDFIHLEHTEKGNGLVSEDDWGCARKISDAVLSFTKSADVVMVEQPIGSQSARASWTSGIVLGILASIPKPVMRFRPDAVKLHFTGDKNASKRDMIDRAKKLFPSVTLPTTKKRGKTVIVSSRAEHICDALAVLYLGAKTLKEAGGLDG